MKFIFLLYVLFCMSVNCEYYELWKPSFIAELLSNKSIKIQNHIKNESDVFSNMIIKYVDVAKQKQDTLINNVDVLIKSTGRQINDTFYSYLKVVPYLGNEISRKDKNVTKVNTSYFDAAQLIAMNGYNVETHTILTDDGYLLTLHRIPHGKNSSVTSVNQQAVILQHGLLSSSVDFVSNGPKKGLAFILADAGYDVWLGNFRGNGYSRAHVKYSIDEPAFWNFSWHEIALHDLPAMIDYVNSIKKSTKETLYIGHSMGTTALFVLLSLKPEYNEKLKAAFCLAPVAYMTSLKSPLTRFASLTGSLEWFRDYLGANEFVPKQAILNWLAMNCDSHFYKDKVCGNLLFLIGGYSEVQLDNDHLLDILSHAPAGASTKSIIHFAQEIKNKGKFQQFDYGATNNMKVYGQKTPPEYPLNKISLPIGLYVSHSDLFVGMPDSIKLHKELPNPIEMYEVPLEEFNHLDFLWGVDAKHLLYDHLLQTMDKYRTDQGVLWSANPFDKLKLSFNWKTIDSN